MNKKILSISIISILISQSAFAEDKKKLTFYRDLTEYKEYKTVVPEKNGSIKIDLINTAVLNSFNVVMNKDGKEILPASIEVHKKSAENILKLNQGEKVFVNGKEYILESNGEGFLTLINKDNLITYISKKKIEEINFVNNISSINHIAKINLREKEEKIDIDYSYMLGQLNWRPSYNFYIKDEDTAQLDYYIEINNQTLNTFKDINLEVVVDDNPELINTYYTSTDQGGVFDYTEKIKIENNYKINIKNERGYPVSAYNSEGFQRYEAPTKRTEIGTRIFSLPNKITLSPKSKSKHLYMDTAEIKFDKINYLNEPSLEYKSKDEKINKIFEVYSYLNFKNEEGVFYKKGIASLYSKEKLDFNKILLKEFNIEENFKNEHFRMDLGKNADLYLEHIEKDQIFYMSDLPIINEKKEIMEKIEKIKKGYELKNPYINTFLNIGVSKNVLKVKNQKNKKTKNLFMHGNSYFVKEEDVKKIKILLENYENTPNKEKTYKTYLKLKQDIFDFAKMLRFDINVKDSDFIKYETLKDSEFITYYTLSKSDNEMTLEIFDSQYGADFEEIQEFEDYFKLLD